MTEERKLLRVFDDAVNEELQRVSHVPYDSNSICTTFAENIRNRITALLAAPAPEPVAWAREWEGDSSDLNHMIVEFDKSQCDEPLDRWMPLYTIPVAPSKEVIEQLAELHKLYTTPPASPWVRCAERLPYVVAYRRKESGEDWIPMAAFDSNRVAQNYACNCAASSNGHWEYEVQPLPSLPEDKK